MRFAGIVVLLCAVSLPSKSQAPSLQFDATRELELVWSLNGPYTGVVWDAANEVLHASTGNSLADLDRDGKMTRQIDFPRAANLRIAHFADEGTVLLAFGTWSRAVTAYTLEGRHLWEYSAGGIDDVWPADLDGDGSDEVIVGFNGKVGLHILDSKGRELWKYGSIANVWHVSVGDIRGEGKPQIVSTSALGQVHVFNRDLTDRRDFDPGFFATMVRTGPIFRNDKAETIFTLGQSTSGASTRTLATAISGDGARKWAVQLPGAQPVYSMYLMPGKHWLAVGRQGGEVDVVDIERGAVVGSALGQGLDPEISWVNTRDSEVPLLVVSTGSGLNAFRTTPAK